MGGHGAGEIDPVHEASAEERVEGIGVVGQNDLDHLGDRFAHGARAQGFVVVIHRVSLRDCEAVISGESGVVRVR